MNPNIGSAARGTLGKPNRNLVSVYPRFLQSFKTPDPHREILVLKICTAFYTLVFYTTLLTRPSLSKWLDLTLF
jgi:hypothetical protein